MSFVHFGGRYCACAAPSPLSLPPPPHAMPPAVVPPSSRSVRTSVTPRDLTPTPFLSCHGDEARLDAFAFARSLISSSSSPDAVALFSRRSSPISARSCGSPWSRRSPISSPSYERGPRNPTGFLGNFSSWHAGDSRAGRHIPRHDGPGAYESAASDANPAEDYGSGADRRLVFDVRLEQL